MKKNILLKLSGASLKNNDDVICDKKINKLAEEICNISNQYNIGIVIGGGNIWRGKISSEIGMNRSSADDMGMLATLINSLALKASIQKHGLEAVVYSSFSIPRMAEEHNAEKFNKDLNNGKVVIFAGGTGMPFFSTDTAASLCASEINASCILMGKNNVNGLYDKDPNKFDDANFIKEITFNEVIQRKLEVADSTSITMCEENNINIIIFDIEKKDSILNALNGVGDFSLIYNEKNNNQFESKQELNYDRNEDSLINNESNDDNKEIKQNNTESFDDDETSSRLESILKRNKEELDKIKNLK